MRYVLCTRDRATGRATVLGETTFATTQEATDAIAHGRVVAPFGGDVRLVDLDAATPVVVVAAQALEVPLTPQAEVPEPDLSEAATAPAPQSPTMEPTTPAPEAEPAETRRALFEPTPEPPGAFDEPEPLTVTWQALQESAGTFMFAEPAAEPVEVPEPEDGRPAGNWPFMVEDDASVGPSIVGEDRLEDDAARSELWWAEVGAEDAGATEVASVAAEPGVFGFEDAAAVAAEIGALVGEAPVQEELPAEAPPVQEPLPDVAEAPSDVEEVGVAVDAVDPWEAAPGADLEEGSSDAGLVRIDFDAWSCGDCVFTSTCPRSGADRPMTCGSFQWRAE